MKKIIKRIFNRSTITGFTTTAVEMADLLNEPLPTTDNVVGMAGPLKEPLLTAEDVMAWYNKHIPANDRY